MALTQKKKKLSVWLSLSKIDLENRLTEHSEDQRWLRAFFSIFFLPNKLGGNLVFSVS